MGELLDWQLPTVTIIVIVLNNAKGIGESLQWLVNLDYPKNRYEIIVVDNGSTDGTSEVVKSFSVQLVEEPKRGFPPARNTGIKHATGEIIVFTDSDCIGNSSWLRSLVAPFSNQEVGETGGLIRPYSVNGSIIERFIDEAGFVAGPKLINQGIIPFITTQNIAVRRKLIYQVGGFDEQFIFCSDVDLSRKIQLWGKSVAVIVPDAIVYHHHHQKLKSMGWLCYRNAYGSILLATRWKNFVPFHTTLKKELSTYLNEFKSLVIYIASFLKRLVLFIFTKKDNYYLLKPLLFFIAEMNAIIGKTKALWITRGLRSLPEERK
jgi:glycosyltransferase involved in cell wall biosynthesis